MTIVEIEPETGSDQPPAAVQGQPVRESDAARQVSQLFPPQVIDGLLADAQTRGLAVDGPGGLIQQMIGAVLERALETEMAEHLGYEKGQAPAGGGADGNHRNGHSAKTVITTAGPVRINVPRDRGSSFEPRIVPKRRRRLGQDEAILSLYARGMTTRDIRDHLAEVYGTDVSHETVANVTDVVADEVRTWQNRPALAFARHTGHPSSIPRAPERSSLHACQSSIWGSLHPTSAFRDGMIRTLDKPYHP